MKGWHDIILGTISNFSYGTMPNKEKVGLGNYPIFSGYKYQYTYPEYNCEQGDLIVVARGVGGTGDVKIVRERCYLTNLSIKIDADLSLLDSKFFYYANAIENLRYLDSGSAQSQITIADLSKITVTLPPIEDQKAIASILSTLDDKIDLLHRQNNTLEAMAEALFRQWFVEEAQEDWRTGNLPEEFEFIMGQSPPGSSFNENGVGVPMFQGNADFGFRFPNERIYTTDPTRFAKKFDTLISVRAPVGAQNMALNDCCIGRGVAAFRYKLIKDGYTYAYFKLRSLMVEIKKFDDEGTVFGSISKSDFEALEIVIPPLSLVENFEKTAKPINDKIIQNCFQIKTLEKLRDTLLPKLMSSEVRVAV
jgi:type I restriction enzyme S subunit